STGAFGGLTPASMLAVTERASGSMPGHGSRSAMNTLTREELQRIGRSDGGLCVSLYLPTETAGKETLTNPTRLRHLLRHARQRLIEAKVDAREADRVLRPAEDLVADYPFWQHQEAGLGLLLGPGGMTAYKIPYPVQELAVV